MCYIFRGILILMSQMGYDNKFPAGAVKKIPTAAASIQAVARPSLIIPDPWLGFLDIYKIYIHQPALVY